MAITDYSEEREYGAVAAEEQQAEDVEMAAMVGDQADAEAQAAVAQAQGEPTEESPMEAAPVKQQPTPFTPKNVMQLASPRLLYKQRGKSPAEAQYDVGLLWKVVADDPRSSPMTKLITERLRREEG